MTKELKETIEKIKELVEDNEITQRRKIQDFLGILFWKDYSKGYISAEDKADIFNQIETHWENHIDYSKVNLEGILPFINELRKKINLPELVLIKEKGYLCEIDVYNALIKEQEEKEK